MKQSMGARMIFHSDNDLVQHFICSGGACDPKAAAEYFDCYSVQHAKDVGWRFSESPELVPSPGVMCPACVSYNGLM
jgi:hypothetical protein